MSSGLNAVLYATRFTLPTVQTVLRGVEVNSYYADLDIGDIDVPQVLAAPESLAILWS